MARRCLGGNNRFLAAIIGLFLCLVYKCLLALQWAGEGVKPLKYNGIPKKGKNLPFVGSTRAFSEKSLETFSQFEEGADFVRVFLASPVHKVLTFHARGNI